MITTLKKLWKCARGNEALTIQVKKLHPDAAIPTKSYRDDAGWDLYAVEDVTIQPGQTAVIKTGISAKIPVGWYGHIKARSRHGANGLVATAGVVDCAFRGEIKAVLVNCNHVPLLIRKGDRVAQMLILPVPDVEWSEVDCLDHTERGVSGWGSTGS